MDENLALKPPTLMISDQTKLISFIDRSDSPLILQTKFMQVFTFGTREESFGHEMVRFQIVEAAEKVSEEVKDNLFFSYASPGFCFTDFGRYLFFISPIGGAGIFDPARNHFAIMYPLIVIDLSEKRFAFVKNNINGPFTNETILQNIKKADYKWYLGFQHHDIVNKFRLLHPRIDIRSVQPPPKKESFLERILKFFLPNE